MNLIGGELSSSLSDGAKLNQSQSAANFGNYRQQKSQKQTTTGGKVLSSQLHPSAVTILIWLSALA